jgi:hypothetical protein
MSQDGGGLALPLLGRHQLLMASLICLAADRECCSISLALLIREFTASSLNSGWRAVLAGSLTMTQVPPSLSAVSASGQGPRQRFAASLRKNSGVLPGRAALIYASEGWGFESPRARSCFS